MKSGSEVEQSRSGSFLGKLFGHPGKARRSAALHEGTVASNGEMDGGVYGGARNAKGSATAQAAPVVEGDPEGRTEYAGAWKGGLRHREGAQKWASGGSCNGAGPGRDGGRRDLRDAVGAVLRGGRRANNKHGQGTMRWPSRDAFVGEWEPGLPSGRGTKPWADQASYAGEWHEGKKHGHGRESGAGAAQARRTSVNGSSESGRGKENSHPRKAGATLVTGKTTRRTGAGPKKTRTGGCAGSGRQQTVGNGKGYVDEGATKETLRGRLG